MARLVRRLLAPIALVAVGACVPLGGTSDPVPEAPGTNVVLERGPFTRAAELAAREKTDEAAALLAAGAAGEAEGVARSAVELYPTAPAAVDALLVAAGAALAHAGSGDDEAAGRALTDARRLLGIVPVSDARRGRALRLQAEALVALGRPRDALTSLLAAPADVLPADAAMLDWVRRVAGGLEGDELALVVQAAPLGQPLVAPVQTLYARVLLLAGDRDGARRFAQAALDTGASGDDAEIASAILGGRAVAGAPAPVIAAILPVGGSPALSRFADELRSGIEAAIAGSGFGPDGVTLEVLDDGGDPARAAALVREAEARGVSAVVGPVGQEAFVAAARARSGSVPLMSPTAWDVPGDVTGAYSLGNEDPGGVIALVDWSRSAGYDQVMVLHPASGPGSGEGPAFERLFEEAGGSVLRRLTYEPGATFFREQMLAVQGLRPQALILPVPPEDVQALASQAAFFALDTLGVQVLGTAGWAHPEVAATVSSRFTDGVVIAAPVEPGDGGEGYRRFVEAWEAYFQRSLVEPTGPSLGYDATSLVLRALETGVRDPREVAATLAEVRGFAGATGLLSVEDGRVLRRHAIVCMAGGERLPLAAAERPVPVFRPYLPDPETGEVPEGPGRQAGFVCPSLAPPPPPGAH